MQTVTITGPKTKDAQGYGAVSVQGQKFRVGEPTKVRKQSVIDTLQDEESWVRKNFNVEVGGEESPSAEGDEPEASEGDLDSLSGPQG